MNSSARTFSYGRICQSFLLCLSSILLVGCVKDSILPEKPTSQVTSPTAIYDWQRKDKYVPPDFEAFFPHDLAGGKKLDALFHGRLTGSYTEEEVLGIVRNGLRRTSENRSRILSTLIGPCVWRKAPPNPKAVEIMYHAAQTDNKYGTRYNAVYYGLSVLRPKPPNVLRTLAEICMKGEQVGRITWGCTNQIDQLRSYLTPHLQSDDQRIREVASALDKHFRGEINFDKWKRDKQTEEARAKYFRQFPEFKVALKTGDSEARTAVLREVRRNPALLRSLDDSFLEPFVACAKDPEPGVRREVARIVGSRWICGQEKQNQQAVSLIMTLSKDHAARHNAVHFGLLAVRPKSDEVIRRLVKMAVEEHDGEIASALRTEKKRAAPLLVPYLDAHRSRPDAALNAYLLYTEITGKEPPQPERFSEMGRFAFRVVTKDGAVLGREEFAREFTEYFTGRVLGASLALITSHDGRPAGGLAVVNGVRDRKALLEAIRLRPPKRIVIDTKTLLFTENMERALRDNWLEYDLATTYEQVFQDLFVVLRNNYPCFKLKGIDWKAVGQELLPRAKTVTTDEEFALLCMELVARLEDSHARLLAGKLAPHTPAFPRWDPGFACLIDDHGKPVVYYVDKTSSADKAGIRIGMTVLSVNGTPAEQAIAECMTRASKYQGYSSERYLRYQAARWFVRQMKKGTVVTLKMQTPGGPTRTFKLPANLGVRYLPRLPVPIKGVSDSSNVSWTIIKGNVGYIYVRRIRKDLIAQLDRAVAELKGAQGLIIDVRGNSGGGFDQRRAHRNFAIDDKEEPDRPRFEGPIALLLDSRCVSAGEGWASWFIAKKRAKAFGSATAGASSRKRVYTLKNKLYKVRFSAKAYRGFLDRPIERVGLKPDVPLRQNAQDLIAGRDTVLEAARIYLIGHVSGSSRPAQPCRIHTMGEDGREK